MILLAAVGMILIGIFGEVALLEWPLVAAGSCLIATCAWAIGDHRYKLQSHRLSLVNLELNEQLRREGYLPFNIFKKMDTMDTEEEDEYSRLLIKR